MPTRLEVLEMMVGKQPADPFPYYGLALEYRSAGRVDDSITAFTRLRERFPDYVPTYLMAAQACQELGRRDGAAEWCRAGIEAARRGRDAHAAGELEAFLGTLGE